MAQAVDYFVLQGAIEPDEACREASDAHDKVLIILGVLLRAAKGINVGDVTLEELTATRKEGSRALQIRARGPT